ncbi:C4-dicarboxylate ABC transporter substrate-binding protein [Schlegelella sp. S2-27]|uniref:C4-dicarboxylate ABC transporter substrate-binding protein n=1 Tax=Caldimonas mangrovi TaxID=2944811 RepID=A0ABT0YUB5_9BURK|nr:TAXI family TRAP transporter solute-binding subunit [Caldimonas mangrovi]MCM5682341.1 C4-dicarboxylate ABC transporter substrate-binding protein [Caldimonas mangrovi]
MSFSRLRLLVLSLRDLIPATTPVIVIALLLIVGAFWLLDPTPPKRLVMATGAEQSAYEVLGRRYRDALAPFGIEVELRASAGSAENLASLQSAGSGVDVAFVQGGTYRPPPGEHDPHDLDLASLGSLFYEPVWLFYREDSAKRLLKKPRLESITELKGWRMNAGAPGSGVKVLAEELLELNALPPQELQLSHLANTPAVVELLEARSDAMLFVSAPHSPLIQMLLQTPGIRLFSFSQAQAYARKLPYLSAVTLPRGVVDLSRDLPGEDVQLIAPTATLVAREGLHPALVQLLMQAAGRIHGEPGWFAHSGEFPNATATDLPLSGEAARYLKNGAPWLQRYLPFWVSNLVDRMWVALLSIVAVLIPLSRLVPPLYEFRVRSRVFRWYARLREVEDALERGDVDREELLQQLNDVEARAAHITLPLSYADELYALRQHIDLVRSKLRNAAPATTAA